MISCLKTFNNCGKTLKSHYKSDDRFRYLYRSGVLSAVAVAFSQSVFAVTNLDHTFTPYVGSSHSYDSNLLRSQDNADTSFIHQIRAGLNVDWRYSLQQLIIKGEVNHNWFTNFSELDYLGHNVLAQWNWVAGSKLKGEIGYKHEEALASFAQLNATRAALNNLQTSQNYFANAEYQILPSIYLKAGFLRNEWLYDGNDREISNQIQNIGEFSVQYRNLSRTMIGFRAVITDGQYPKRSALSIDSGDNGFFRTSYHVDGEWKYSDKLRIGGSVGYLQQDYEHGDTYQIGFSDAVARLDVNWIPSEKTTLAFSAWREVDQAFTLNASFVLSTGARITPSWVPTTKIRLEIPLSFETQDYLGDSPNSIGGNRRSDEVVDLGVNLIYNPWINTELALKFEHENRDSSQENSSYEAQTVGITAKVEF
ncbi:conserved hypothetical protein [Crenothrix polyspora]|uniref:Exopolysaccharide biosynthesis operon protein EpsL n=1 Tax=Crenothrix polyspora TaxID=360316 RepID=A0A1R4HEU6_9GAMM|nr:conserved hypothetical protein [Crenothrix polyspora]